MTLTNLTQNNVPTPVDTFSQLAIHTPGQFLQAGDAYFQYRIDSIGQEKNPAFVFGEMFYKLASKVWSFVPEIKFPFASATKTPNNFSLKLPKSQALKKIGEILEVIDAKNKQETEKAKNRFLEQFEKTLKEEGNLFRENIGIWLTYSEKYMYKQPKIHLLCHEKNEHGISVVSPAYYDNDVNNAVFFVGSGIENVEIMQNIVTTISQYAADHTRRSFAVSEGESRGKSFTVAYMLDSDRTESQQAISQCEEKLHEVRDKVVNCLQKENCDSSTDPDLEALKKNNRKCVEQRPVVQKSPFDSFKCSTDIQFLVLPQVKNLDTKMQKTAGVIQQILKESVAKEICPENYQRQKEQNKKFAEMVQDKTSGFRDEL